MSVVGIAVWSGVLLGAAIAGVYRAEYVGVVGWTVSLLTLPRLLKQNDFSPQVPLRLSAWDRILMAGLALTAWLYLGFPTESMWGARDQGVYANHGIYIAHHGRLDIPYPWHKDDGSVLSEGYQVAAGLFRTQPTMTVQFAHLLPVWLAQAFSTFGYQGVFRLNGVFALISLSMFYGLCRLTVPKPYAVIATLFLALNPGQIWLARITLTEILTQLFIVSGLFSLLQALQDDDSRLARWAGVFFGCSALTRIDGFLLIPFLLLSHLALKLVDIPTINKPTTVWPGLYRGAFPIFALALGYYAVLSTPYFLALAPQLLLAALASVASLVALGAATSGTLQRVRPWVTTRTVWALFGLIAVALAYAYWIRPAMGPYATMHLPGHPVDGARDYREDSLVNLVRYLSPPIVCAAVLGWCVGVYRLVIGKDNLPLVAGLVIVGGFSGVFLWNPSITPDHFWAIRRFIPVVIPGFIFFASFGVWWVLSRFSPGGALKLALPLLLLLVAFLIRADAVLFLFAENKGLFEQFRQLAERLPRDEVIVAYEPGSWGAWTLPLHLAFDRQIVLLDVYTEEGKKTLNQWVAKQVARQESVAFVAQGEPLRLCGFEVRQADRFTLSRSYIEGAVTPPPRKVTSQHIPITLYEITGKNEDIDNRVVNVGTKAVPGVEQEGFSNPEQSGGHPIRWTTGNAKLTIPINQQCAPQALKLTLASTGPKGTRLQVVVNGRRFFDEQVPPSWWSRTFALTDLHREKAVTVEIISDTFVPRETIQGSGDARTLGVLVYNLSLLE